MRLRRRKGKKVWKKYEVRITEVTNIRYAVVRYVCVS
jgi:hypothetical protein